MKKILVICLCLLLLLSACGNKTADPSIPDSSGTSTGDNAVPDHDSDTSVPSDTSDDSTVSSDTSSDTSVDEQKKLAESCIDKSVTELYDLIGEPLSSDYAPSCNGGEGAEDGNLYYDGFIVYPLKEGDSETVVFVE